jgi:hypothetical protein
MRSIFSDRAVFIHVRESGVGEGIIVGVGVGNGVSVGIGVSVGKGVGVSADSCIAVGDSVMLYY